MSLSDKPVCPHCGESYGYFERRRVTLEQHIPYSGAEETRHCEMLERGTPVKRQYCSDCRRDVTKFIAKLKADGVIE